MSTDETSLAPQIPNQTPSTPADPEEVSKANKLAKEQREDQKVKDQSEENLPQKENQDSAFGTWAEIIREEEEQIERHRTLFRRPWEEPWSDDVSSDETEDEDRSRQPIEGTEDSSTSSCEDQDELPFSPPRMEVLWRSDLSEFSTLDSEDEYEEERDMSQILYDFFWSMATETDDRSIYDHPRLAGFGDGITRYERGVKGIRGREVRRPRRGE